ncbi:MAG: hypothetical protein Q8M65_04320 [Rhodoglobus sp.]|nr:hypothetical protein [Rhodoglobus sp.]
MSIFVDTQGAPVRVSCGITDVSGRLSNFPGLQQAVPSGRWTHVAATDVFELPDLTIGVRCYPSRDAWLIVIVRDLSLAAEPAG